MAKLHLVPEENLPSNYAGLAISAREVAVYSLLLGNKAEALEYSKKSSEFFICYVEAERKRVGRCVSAIESMECHDALSMAVLSGDTAQVDRSLRCTLEVCREFPQKHRGRALEHYVHMAEAFYLAGMTGEAVLYIGKIEPKGREKNFYSASKVALQGLVNNDKAEIVEGLNAILLYHSRKYKGSVLPVREISLPATVFIKIAQDKGIIIKPDDLEGKLIKWVPWNLFI